MIYSELSSLVGVKEEPLTRLVRLAIASGFLAEDNGLVKHNAVSSIFKKNPCGVEGIEWSLNTMFGSACKISEALKLDGTCEDNTKTALSVEFAEGSTYRSMWELHAANPTLDKGFHSMLSADLFKESFSVQHLVHAFDWTTIRTLVDVRKLYIGSCAALTNSSRINRSVVVRDRLQRLS